MRNSVVAIWCGALLFLALPLRLHAAFGKNVLADRRIAWGSIRYCDLALGEFDRLTKQDFDIESASIPERDPAISRALAWIKGR